MTDIALGHVTANLNLPQSGSTVPVPVDAIQSVTFTPTTLEMNDAGQALNNAFTADFVSGQLTYNGQTGVYLYPGSWTVTFIPSLNHLPIDLFVTPGAEINLFDWNDNSNVIVPTKDAADGDLLDWDGEKPSWIPPTGIKGIGTAAFQNVSAFATAAQGSKADTALQEANYDAVKQAADDAKASAAQSAADAHAANQTLSQFNLTASAGSLPAGSNPTVATSGTMPNYSLLFGIPAGQPSTYELRGSGSPYNSVTPPGAGYYYTDTAGTNGAWRWMSTGTSKTSWTVISGDTGWRSIADSTFTSGALLLRRINNMILSNAGIGTFRRFYVDSAKNNVASPVLITDGFKPNATEFLVCHLDSDKSNCGVIELQSGGVIIPRLTTTAVAIQAETATWGAVGSWPTTLPGTAL